MRETRGAYAEFLWAMRALQRATGISEAEIRARERADEAERLPGGNELWRKDVLQARTTEDLDTLAARGLERLLQNIDPGWLRLQAQKPYRLTTAFLNSPLHIVNGVRVGTAPDEDAPQRFAHMLLVSRDYLNGHPDVDFFAAAAFLPEVAILGNSLDEIAHLGSEAAIKLERLPLMPDDKVTSTVFELLVGAACVRRGLTVTMVEENGSTKVPDFRISGLGALAGAIECKRRLGLSQYELEEARKVASLYSDVRGLLKDRGIFGAVEASFAVEVSEVPREDFIIQVLAVAGQDVERASRTTEWGTLAFRRLHYYGTLSPSRLYSNEFLDRVFQWGEQEDDWDGLLCEVDPPSRVEVRSFRAPLCMKWKSESTKALTKKSRGILSLWGDAIKQIPAGHNGFIYLAYPEGSRSAVADARTQHILQSLQESWHKWYVRVPVCIVSRLFSRSLRNGCPDLIENVLCGTAKGQEFWLAKVPTTIFTKQFD